jgi:hypothetical protein
MMQRTPFLIAFVGTIAAAVAAVRAQDDARPLSAAQTALFESDHLASIVRPERLEYRFSHEVGESSGDYLDRIDLDVRPRDDGLKDVWVDFLAGANHRPFPPLIGFRGNPLVMYFLERDVEEMRRATGGAAAYFRNRIRSAFVDQATLRPIELRRDDRTETASEITLAPFRDDARLAPFPGLRDKAYRFVLAETVPGAVYEIVAEVPGEPGQKPRLRETMTFLAEQPCATSEGPCAKPGSK